MQWKGDSLRLYAVTDRMGENEQTLCERIEQALRGGVTCLQLREKALTQEEFLQEAIIVKKLCQTYGVPLIINDNLEVALKSGADGIHVGQEDVSVAEIRRRAGKDFVIGATAKTVAQAQRAQSEGADYLGVGAVFPSPTKTGAIRITHQQLKEICASVRIPAVAIGGITRSNMEELRGAGICGFAVVSAIFGAENPEEAAKELLAYAEVLL